MIQSTTGVCSLVCLLGSLSLIAGCQAQASVPAVEEAMGESSAELSTDICPAGVPGSLTPAADQTLKSTFMGVGVQIYTCAIQANGGYLWTLVGPNANLLDDDGKLVGTHFIGPTWQGTDGSSVVAKKLAGATVDAANLPWLLLGATAHGAEEGRFSSITSIQRLSTVGGNAPPDGCDAAHAGSITQIPYSAQYVFYRTKTEGNVKQCGG